MKPTLFIGSSTEGLNLAYAVQHNLEDIAEVIVWKQGVFKLTKSYLESLVEMLDETDYGLFVFTPDDVTTMRGMELAVVRDNVIFELGLFIGRLGRERCFILMPKESPDFYLPSDLLGISTAKYTEPSKPDRLQAALGPACFEVRNAIQRLPSETTSPSKYAPDIESFINFVLTEAEKKHLLNLARGRTQKYKGRSSVRKELRNLRSRGLIRKHTHRHIGDLESGKIHDLSDFVELTELGQKWASKLDDNV